MKNRQAFTIELGLWEEDSSFVKGDTAEEDDLPQVTSVKVGKQIYCQYSVAKCSGAVSDRRL